MPERAQPAPARAALLLLARTPWVSPHDAAQALQEFSANQQRTAHAEASARLGLAYYGSIPGGKPMRIVHRETYEAACRKLGVEPALDRWPEDAHFSLVEADTLDKVNRRKNRIRAAAKMPVVDPPEAPPEPQAPTPAPTSTERPTTCLEPGCSRPPRTRGLCEAHYRSRKRAGTLDEIALPPMTRQETGSIGGSTPRKSSTARTEPPEASAPAPMLTDTPPDDRAELLVRVWKAEAMLRDVEAAIADIIPRDKTGDTLGDRVRWIIAERHDRGQRLITALGTIARLERDLASPVGSGFSSGLERLRHWVAANQIHRLETTDGLLIERRPPCSP